jgi:hypothetical protein
VSGAKIRDAAADLNAAMVKQHKKLVDKLNEGTKPEDEDIQTIVELAKKIAHTFAPSKKKAEE